MTDIERITKSFAKTIKATDTYQKFSYEKDKMNRNPGLKRQMDEYRKMIYDFQNSSNQDALFDEVDRMMEYSDRIRSNPEVNHFLAAELALCRMMQEIYAELTNELNFDMDLTVLQD